MLFSSVRLQSRGRKECFKLLKSPTSWMGSYAERRHVRRRNTRRIDKPMVMLDYKVGGKFPVVVSDHKMGGQLLAQEFINSGCKYVIHISGIKVDGEYHVI